MRLEHCNKAIIAIALFLLIGTKIAQAAPSESETKAWLLSNVNQHMTGVIWAQEESDNAFDVDNNYLTFETRIDFYSDGGWERHVVTIDLKKTGQIEIDRGGRNYDGLIIFTCHERHGECIVVQTYNIGRGRYLKSVGTLEDEYVRTSVNIEAENDYWAIKITKAFNHLKSFYPTKGLDDLF